MPRAPLVLAILTGIAVLAGCTAAGGGGSPGPTVIPGGSGGSMTAGQLRVAIVERFGPRWWCDPDFYPIARSDEQAIAIQRFGQMQAEGDVFGAVVAQLGLAGSTTFSDAQKLAIYQLWKEASTFPLDSLGGGRFGFDYVAQPAAGATQGTHTTGTITDQGVITIQSQAPADRPNCPICLARGTPIDAPDGPIPVERLALGDEVWTLDLAGRRVPGLVIALGSTVAPPDHRVIRLVLADGRTVTASPGHPLADGRRLGDLRLGDVVDGSRVVSLDSLPYGGGETFDLVVSGPTGIYLSDGIPLGSTLR